MGYMPKHIIDNLPDDYNAYFVHIITAFLELKRGNELGLFSYKIKHDGSIILTGDKNYKREKQEIKNIISKIKPLIPGNVKLYDMPRNYPEIRKDLELKISAFTNENNVRYSIEAIFGTTRLPKKNEFEKFKILLAQKIKIKSR